MLWKPKRELIRLERGLITRRGLITGLAAVVAAPYVSKASAQLSMMGVGPVSSGGAAAAAFDAASTKTGVNVVSTSWTHTPVGIPTAVAVVLYWDNSTTALNTLLYGGVPMTLEVRSSGNNKVAIYGLANPPSGAQLIAADWASNVFADCVAISVTGSDTTTCFRNSNSATGTSTAPSVTTTSAAGDLVIDGLDTANFDPGAVTVGAGQTVRANVSQGASFALGVSTENGAASVAMSWTLTNSGLWGAAAASFKHA